MTERTLRAWSLGVGKETWQASVIATMEKELEDAGHDVKELKEKQKALLESLDLTKYAINDAAVDWNTAEGQVRNIEKGGRGTSTIVSWKSSANGESTG